MKIIDPEKGEGCLVDHLTEDVKSCLIVFWHGVGDAVMFQAVLMALAEQYPKVRFEIGLAKGLQEEFIFNGRSVLLEGNWRETVSSLGFDLVFLCHFPAEDLNDDTQTKAEVSCKKELGIPPTSGHMPPAIIKPLIGVHFQNTSVSWLANPDEDTANRIWNEVIEAGCTPIETHWEHGFHNPTNARFGFVDNHVRGWPARLDACISVIARLDAFIGVVSGPFHLALSLLPPERVMLLEKELKAGHFTKTKIATADLKNYKGEVKAFLEGLRCAPR